MFARLIVVVISMWIEKKAKSKKIVWLNAMDRSLVGRTSIYSICVALCACIAISMTQEYEQQ